jgi:hypothetical protein
MDLSELRARLTSLLVRWQAGELTAAEVHAEAESLWDAEAEWPTLPEAQFGAIVIEVLQQLDIMNHQLILRQDTPAILAFLKAEPGEEQVAWQRWRAYWEGLDYPARRQELATDPFYNA